MTDEYRSIFIPSRELFDQHGVEYSAASGCYKANPLAFPKEDESLTGSWSFDGGANFEGTDGTNSALEMPEGTDPTSPAEGDVWHDDTLKVYDGDFTRSMVGGVYSEGTETSGSTSGSSPTFDVGLMNYAFPANFFIQHRGFRFVAWGYADSGNGSTVDLTLRFGDDGALMSSRSILISHKGIDAGDEWRIEGMILCEATGGGGTWNGWAWLQDDDPPNSYQCNAVEGVSEPTTVSLNLAVAFHSGNFLQTVTCYQRGMSIEVIT